MSLRVGTICYATDQGIAHLAKWFHEAGVITDVMTFRHGSRPGHAAEWYGPNTVELVGRPFDGPVVEEFIRRVDVMLFFETPFDWDVLALIRRLGRRSVIVPMYECTPERYTPISPRRDKDVFPDKWICPSSLDCRYFPGSPLLPVPLPPSVAPWKLRTRADRFLHNGGNLGLRGHKGTKEILQAMRHVRSPISLTVRAQDDAGLERIVREIPGVADDRRIKFEFGQTPYDKLFTDEHDVFVMAEKYNGLSLPLAEARASGMVVMTSDRFPMNEWLPREPLIAVSGYVRARVGGPYNEYDEAVVQPEAIAVAIDSVYERGRREGWANYSYSALEYRDRNSWATLGGAWIKELSS